MPRTDVRRTARGKVTPFATVADHLLEAAVGPPAGTGPSTGSGAGPGTVTMRRVSFNLPEPLFKDIQNFAAERGDTMTGVLRWSLGIGKAIWDEVRAGHRVQVIDSGRDVVKELVLQPY